MEEYNKNNFYENEELSSMIIKENISMAFIYEKLKDKYFSFDKEGIKILNHKNGIFDIHYKDIILEYIFEEPINIKIKNKSIDIISAAHLQQIIQKYNIISPYIKCKICGSTYKYNLTNIFKHKNDEISIESIEDYYIRIQEDNFDEFFNKEHGCLGKTYKNPEEFDKNFEFYFKNYEQIYRNKPFVLYKNKKRESFINSLKQEILLSIGRFFAYFGQSGIGKSITMITVTKYITNHTYYGTLYLNMKYLNFLLKKEYYKKLKQILIDEIPYLFCNRYDEYFKCIRLIALFNFENDESFWDLISKIIEVVNKIPDDKRKYIFVFDEYKDKIDKNDNLTQIFEKYSKKKSKKSFGFITLSSMNNNDIKKNKINFIKQQLDINYNNEKYYNKYLEEFDEIFDFEGLKFDDDSYEEYFELLGRNIKNYNILNNYLFNQKNIKNYIDEIKEKIKNKIKLFYECDIDVKKLICLLYFSTTTKYDLDSFIKVAEYVPFKYYIPEVKTDNDNNKYIKINFASPLIEEIINELYDNILYFEYNIYEFLLNNNLVDDGALEKMFVKFFIYHLKPNTNIFQKKLVFEDIDIIDTITLNMLYPRKNEEIKEMIKKKKLDKGDYLFTQKIIDRKDIDFLIVSIDESNWAKILAFRIATHIPAEKIYTKKYLKNCFYRLKDNLLKLFDFNLEEDNIYFSYIFDKTFETKEKVLFDKMIQKCHDEGMSYMIFDPLLIELYNKNRKKVEHLTLNTLSPFHDKCYKRSSFGDSDKFEAFLKVIPQKDKMPYLPNIQPFEMKIAIDKLRKDTEYGNTIKELKFLSYKFFPVRKDFKINEIYFGRTSPSCELFMIYFSKTRQKFIHSFLNGNKDKNCVDDDIFQLFDIYEIITEN